MKKTFRIEIAKPCNEKFELMTPNSEGSFCDLCVKTVVDFSLKTKAEVNQFVLENQNKSVCMRLTQQNLNDTYTNFEPQKSSSLNYAMAVAASVLISSSVVSQKVGCAKPVGSVKPDTISRNIMGKMIAKSQEPQKMLVELKGVLLHLKTQKPMAQSVTETIKISMAHNPKKVLVNPKSGTFVLPKMWVFNHQNVVFEISIGADIIYQKATISLNTKSKPEFVVLLVDYPELKIMGEMAVMPSK